ncbi:MAG: hypothetical protein ACYDAM_09480 [Leptospirales bacterium]
MTTFGWWFLSAIVLLILLILVYVTKLPGDERAIFLNIVSIAFQIGGTGISGTFAYYGFQKGISGTMSPKEQFTWLLMGFGTFFATFSASGLLSVKAKQAEKGKQDEHNNVQSAL